MAENFREKPTVVERLKTNTGRAVIALGVATTSLLGISTSASAENGGCYGIDCSGLDPAGLCDGDAQTVASKAIISTEGVYEGQLDLRYSDSCKSNWGRFTSASGPREALSHILGPRTPAYGRVTVWNPGLISFDMQHRGPGSQWSGMTDGRKVACTGVETFYTEHGPGGSSSGYVKYVSGGWKWGPCR